MAESSIHSSDSEVNDEYINRLIDNPQIVEEVVMTEIEDQYNMEKEINSRPGKRTLEDDQEGWIEKRSGKRIRENVESVYISCKEKMPKQFALAKLFKMHNIRNITKVKYINPYKTLVQFDDKDCSDCLTKCEALIQMGWRFKKPYEVDISYGIIRNIDIGLTDKEIMDTISSSVPVANIRRLQRRSENGSEWIDSETVRLGFDSSSLPPFLYIYEMRVPVEPYSFPVTQCSRCWKFGHSRTRCPSKKTVCPKCGKNHDNCESIVFKCVNCTGNHLALSKICPIYLKEKKIRSIMAEFNVQYSKALTMYVPPIDLSIPPQEAPITLENNENINCGKTLSNRTQEPRTYAEIVTSKKSDTEAVSSQLRDNTQKKPKSRQEQKRKKKSKCTVDDTTDVYFWSDENDSDTVSEKVEDQSESRPNKKRCGAESRFRRIIKILKDIIMEDGTFVSKVMKIIQMLVDWVIFADCSFLKSFFNGQ